MSGNFIKKMIAGTFLAGSFFSASLPANTLPTPNPLIVILLGPPGSGKGTQATMLREKLQLPHISTGDLLRENMQRDTELGKQAKSYMESGQLVPDALVLDMLFKRVNEKDCLGGYILDGFPRTLAQAEAFHARLLNASRVIAINLELNDKRIIERLTQRIVCSNCGTPYHLIYSPPKEKGRCDKCHAELKQRNDDNEEVITKRLKVYHQQTEPLIDFYHRTKKLHTIQCDQFSKEKIFSDITALIEKERKI